MATRCCADRAAWPAHAGSTAMNRKDPAAPIRVLLVESLRAQRQFLSGLIEAAPDLCLVGMAATQGDTLDAATRLRPDVIVMNIQMPGADGIAIAGQVMQICPTPVILFCETMSAPVSAAATAAGALTVIQVPRRQIDSQHAADCALFLKTVRVMAGVPVVTRFGAAAAAGRVPPSKTNASYELLAIAASTGGPSVIHQIVRQLGPAFPLPIVLIQHIAHSFVQALAEWLTGVTALPVDVVQMEQRLAPGHIYLAPAHHHLLIGRRGWVTTQHGDATTAGYCPSGDLLFHSVAASYGPQAIGLILSGMGDDGARGLRAMRQAGSLTLAQDEASCVVYGMPRAAVQINAVHQVGTLDQLVSILQQQSAQR